MNFSQDTDDRNEGMSCFSTVPPAKNAEIMSGISHDQFLPNILFKSSLLAITHQYHSPPNDLPRLYIIAVHISA
jgi:hypothetical protein